MSSTSVVPRSLKRRDFIRLAGGGLLALPLLSLLACQRSATTALSPATAGSWAIGGTARIGDASRFPDPFLSGSSQRCALSCVTTIGPCHAASPERMDVSDGWDGLPLRLALRVVDADCQPVPGAIVEIWHTTHTGGYSGQIVRMCNNNASDVDKQFFRGYQRTDANGVVHFNTCYPGWYRGRAVHIHLRVMTGDYVSADRADSWVITQLLFADELNQEIFDQAPLYKEHGQPDTSLVTDNVVGGEVDKSPYLFDVQRMEDGVLFASKTLVIRKAMSDDICEAKGAWGARGPGGPPPGGPDFPGGMPPQPVPR